MYSSLVYCRGRGNTRTMVQLSGDPEVGLPGMSAVQRVFFSLCLFFVNIWASYHDTYLNLLIRMPQIASYSVT